MENVAGIATATATAVDEAEGALEERAAASQVLRERRCGGASCCGICQALLEIDMAFSRTLTIAQWRREVPSLMEAKSHLLHAPMRQSVPPSPELVDKRRRAEERKLLAELSGSDVK